MVFNKFLWNILVLASDELNKIIHVDLITCELWVPSMQNVSGPIWQLSKSN